MSFSFTVAGKIADARAQLAAVSEQYGDPSQMEAAKAFALSELDAWPSGWFNGVLVEASGHHDTNGRNLSISIRPLHLAEPAAPGAAPVETRDAGATP